MSKDTIYREDAVKVISISCETCLTRDTEDCDKCSVPKLRGLINAIPSVDLSSEFSEWARHWFKDSVNRPSGVWIDDGLDAIGVMGVEYRWYKCSQCGFRISKSSSAYYSNFCPDCGARMKGVGANDNRKGNKLTVTNVFYTDGRRRT